MTTTKPMLLGDLASLFVPRPVDYHKALGSFVSKFAEVECHLNYTLWRLAKIPPDIARVALGETRVRNVIDAIRRLKPFLKVDDDDWQQCDKSMSQMSVIASLRNDILHYGSEWVEGETHIISNAGFAHSPKAIRAYTVSSDTLRGAEDDLGVILLSLLVLVSGPNGERYDMARALVRSHAWLYRPPPQQSQKQRQDKRKAQ